MNGILKKKIIVRASSLLKLISNVFFILDASLLSVEYGNIRITFKLLLSIVQ